MNDVALGGAISLVSTIATTVVVYGLNARREMRTRWDRDTLTLVSTSLVSAERAMGRIYAWAQGEISAVAPAARPHPVDEILDLSYYQLMELAVLFPKIAEHASQVQEDLLQLAQLTTEARAGVSTASGPKYLEESNKLRTGIRAAMDEMRGAAQERLAIAK